jgi:hypothetical protein
MHNPVECIALRNNLHGATSTLITRYCVLKGCTAAGAGISSSRGGSAMLAGKHVPGLSWLPASAASAVLSSPMQLLADHLPHDAAQQLQILLADASSNASAAAAAAGALAVAVKQLQRCSLAADVLPTLQLARLDGMARAAAAHGPGGLAGSWRYLVCHVVTHSVS